MNIEFYFDPSCPFCWVTSRWLLLVSNDREINIAWKPFSLAIKNNELESGDNKYAIKHRASHRALRMMMAANEKHGTSLIDMYTTIGIKHHVTGFDIDDELLRNTLSEHNLPAELIKTANSKDYDEQLGKSIADVVGVAGQDIGVPTIVFVSETGEEQGFFGPVLQELPEKQEALDLWDGLSKLATNSSFYELKRSRPRGGPDVGSTARC